MDKKERIDSEAVRVITNLGGPSKTAELLGGAEVITPQAISQWKTKGIPKGWKAFLLTKHASAFGPVQPAKA